MGETACEGRCGLAGSKLVHMPTASISPQEIADVILSAPSEQERKHIAETYLAYSLGALVALLGAERASEIAYRHADAAVSKQ